MRTSLTIALLQAREAAMTFFRPILNRYNLTEQQWRIIRVVDDKRSVDFDTLSKLTCILKPSLTGILNRMERDGLIFKLKPLNDQRKLFISLTQNGQNISKQAHCEIESGYKAIESSFTQEKLALLLTLLDEFIEMGSQNYVTQATEKPDSSAANE